MPTTCRTPREQSRPLHRRPLRVPHLVVIYLGMRVEEARGAQTLEALGPQIQAAVEEGPDGLLLHEQLINSEEPLHVGMRQYWRDFDSLEAWALTLPHKSWWTDYLRDRG